MMLSKRFLSCARRVAFAVVFISAQQLFGGYVYELSGSGPEASKNAMSRIMAQDGKIKFLPAAVAEDNEVIFDGKTQTLIIVDHGRKSYTQLGKAEIEQLSSKIKSAMAEMEAQLAALPPAQREMMEKMMQGRMPKAVAKPEMTLARTGETKEISGYEAEKVELTKGGEKSELWVVDWSKLAGSSEIASGMKGLSGLFNQMMEALSQSPMAGMMQGDTSNWLQQFEKLGGFPVMAKEFDAAGNVISETFLKGVQETTIDSSEFKAPKGYRKQKLEM